MKLASLLIFRVSPSYQNPNKAVISLTQNQIHKYTKEHLGTFFSDGVFCNFFVIFLAPEPPKYANVQIRLMNLKGKEFVLVGRC